MQEIESSVQEWLEDRAKRTPALGTTKHLLQHAKSLLDSWRYDQNCKLKGAKNSFYNGDKKRDLCSFTTIKLQSFIKSLQAIRNPAAHATQASIEQASTLRDQILGIGRQSVLVGLLLWQEALA